ncbi:glutamate decarboxylase-like [Momordica charantia]|uniref:Glutamate decarboxylase-like n=1 Tax=Momordica charantia TaxID=3673 RepID=A0A6J1CY81_MOMCH|nr:glutamate decarboxylase-like [Momordica charantia]
MPEGAKHVSVLRVVIREDFSRTLAERLVLDVIKVLAELDTLPSKNGGKIGSLEEEENGKNEKAMKKKTAEEREREIVSHWRNVTKARKMEMDAANQASPSVTVVAN